MALSCFRPVADTPPGPTPRTSNRCLSPLTTTITIRGQALREKVADHRENRSGDVFRNVASMSELLTAVSVDFNKQSAREQTRVANILKRQAWTKKRVPFDKYGKVCELMDTASERKWRYVPPMYDPKTRTLTPQSDLNPEKSALLSYQEDEE